MIFGHWTNDLEVAIDIEVTGYREVGVRSISKLLIGVVAYMYMSTSQVIRENFGLQVPKTTLNRKKTRILEEKGRSWMGIMT